MSKSAVATGMAVALSLSLMARADAQTGSTSSTTTTTTGSQTATTTGAAKTPAPSAASTVTSTTQTYSWGSNGKLIQPAATTPAATTTTTTTTTGTSSKKKVDDTYVFATSPASNVAHAGGWSTFLNYITLTNGQDQLPFILTMTNGGTGHIPFENLKISLAGQPLATFKDFKGSQLQMKMDGTLVVGNNALTVEGYNKGPGGALSWKLTTMKPVITTAKPANVAQGDTLTISGRNFSSTPAIVQVSIGGVGAPVVTAAGKTLTVTVPSGLKPADNEVVVAVGGIQSKPFKSVSSKAAPTVTGCDFVSTAPGQPLTISGKGFSPKSGDNEVTIGGVSAPISNASATSISVTVPDGIPYPSWGNAIIVKTNGVESKGTVTVNIQQRVIPNDGAPEQ